MSPTRKIQDLDPKDICLSQDHNPPSHMYYAPGVYEHVCSGCGRRFTFIVYGVTC